MNKPAITRRIFLQGLGAAAVAGPQASALSSVLNKLPATSSLQSLSPSMMAPLMKAMDFTRWLFHPGLFTADITSEYFDALMRTEIIARNIDQLMALDNAHPNFNPQWLAELCAHPEHADAWADIAAQSKDIPLRMVHRQREGLKPEPLERTFMSFYRQLSQNEQAIELFARCGNLKEVIAELHAFLPTYLNRLSPLTEALDDRYRKPLYQLVTRSGSSTFAHLLENPPAALRPSLDRIMKTVRDYEAEITRQSLKELPQSAPPPAVADIFLPPLPPELEPHLASLTGGPESHLKPHHHIHTDGLRYDLKPRRAWNHDADTSDHLRGANFSGYRS